MPEINPVRVTRPAPHLTGPVRAIPWADQALCAQTDPDLWFPDGPTATYTTVDGNRESSAKAICGRCPVLTTCREYALERPELAGTWGGMTERERKRWRGMGRVGA